MESIFTFDFSVSNNTSKKPQGLSVLEYSPSEYKVKPCSGFFCKLLNECQEPKSVHPASNKAT